MGTVICGVTLDPAQSVHHPFDQETATLRSKHRERNVDTHSPGTPVGASEWLRPTLLMSLVREDVSRSNKGGFDHSND